MVGFCQSASEPNDLPLQCDPVMLAPSRGTMCDFPAENIEGTISGIEWVPEVFVKGAPGASGSRGCDRTIPAHYRVILTEIGAGPEGSGSGKPRVAESKDAPRELRLNHPMDDGSLAKGFRIRVLGYKRFGDEGGVSTRFQEIQILSK